VYRSFPPDIQYNEDTDVLPGSEGYGALKWLRDEQVLAAGIEGWTELPLWVAESDIDAGGNFLR
jgi:hypothetical protein